MLKRSGVCFTSVVFSPVILCFWEAVGGAEFASIVASGEGNQSGLFLVFCKRNDLLCLWKLILFVEFLDQEYFSLAFMCFLFNLKPPSDSTF